MLEVRQTLLCDIHQGRGERVELPDGKEPTRFSLHGIDYEFDGCEKCDHDLNEALLIFTSSGRRSALGHDLAETPKQRDRQPVPKVPCDFCGRKYGKGPGMTIHVQSKHPDVFAASEAAKIVGANG